MCEHSPNTGCRLLLELGLHARIVRAVDAHYDGEDQFLLALLEDLWTELDEWVLREPACHPGLPCSRCKVSDGL